MTMVSRRAFAGVAGSALLSFSLPRVVIAQPDSIRLSSNENPYGPSPKAMQAMRDSLHIAWQYPSEAEERLTAALAKLHGAQTNQILLGNGSSEILHVAVPAFLAQRRKLVVAEPTFEAIILHAQQAGVEVKRHALTKTYAHDLEAMRGDAAGAGVLYLCNPNNPTATITPREALEEFIAAVPRETVIIVDEAYHHYAASPQYASADRLVQRFPNLVVARTFSKIYGMAGIRCGYALAHADLIRRMDAERQWNAMNSAALAGAAASLDDGDWVALSRRRNAETRSWLAKELGEMGYPPLPSEANFVMIPLRREAAPVIAALRSTGVRVGRVFPAMRDHLRVTIGTMVQMNRFLAAFREVMRQS